MNNGGPAFPFEREGGPPDARYTVKHNGMSLRDWFAGQALGSLIADAIRVGRELPSDLIAQNAYALADAMLAERAKEAKS